MITVAVSDMRAIAHVLTHLCTENQREIDETGIDIDALGTRFFMTPYSYSVAADEIPVCVFGVNRRNVNRPWSTFMVTTPKFNGDAWKTVAAFCKTTLFPLLLTEANPCLMTFVHKDNTAVHRMVTELGAAQADDEPEGPFLRFEWDKKALDDVCIMH